jgi:hypothetical protein
MVEYDRLIDGNPADASLHHQRGLVRWKTGDLDGARADLKTAVALAPDYDRTEFRQMLADFTRQTNLAGMDFGEIAVAGTVLETTDAEPVSVSRLATVYGPVWSQGIQTIPSAVDQMKTTFRAASWQAAQLPNRATSVQTALAHFLSQANARPIAGGFRLKPQRSAAQHDVAVGTPGKLSLEIQNTGGESVRQPALGVKLPASAVGTPWLVVGEKSPVASNTAQSSRINTAKVTVRLTSPQPAAGPQRAGEPKVCRTGDVLRFQVTAADFSKRHRDEMELVVRFGPELKPLRASRGVVLDGETLRWRVSAQQGGIQATKTIELQAVSPCVATEVRADFRFVEGGVGDVYQVAVVASSAPHSGSNQLADPP